MARISVAFRVDAGPQIGLGHLQRCLALASALRHLDATCIFLSTEEHQAQTRIAAFGFQATGLRHIEPGGPEDANQTCGLATSQDCDAVVVDSYSATADYLEHVRRAGLFVVALDDSAGYPFPCQLVVNGGTHALQLPYRALCGNTTFLLGPTYALLRPEFWDTPPQRVIGGAVHHVLLTVGGADAHNLMPRLLLLLDGVPGDFILTAIVGPFFQNRMEIESAVRRCRRPVRLWDAPCSLCDLMREADLAISAGGQTLYELARVGCPTVAVSTASNQDGQLRMFVEAGFVRAVGRADDRGTLNAIGDVVSSLLWDQDTRAALSSAGQELVDGQGALRVAQAIVTACSAAATTG